MSVQKKWLRSFRVIKICFGSSVDDGPVQEKAILSNEWQNVIAVS